MRRLLLVCFCLLVFSSAAMAQNKLDTKWHCSKQSVEHSLAVGDMPGHNYMIMQGTCTATASSSSFPEKTGQYTEFQEQWKDSSSNHGRYNVTMANGDMVYYTYAGKASGTTASNTWKIESGGGHYKGIKGSGTCSGTLNADGSSDWHCTGTTSMGK